MNYNQVRSYSKSFLTTKVGNTSVQVTRLITGVFSFDVWFNPTQTDVCYNVGFEFEAKPGREKVYNLFMETITSDYESFPDEIKPVVDDFLKQLRKGRTKGNLLTLFHRCIKEVLYDYEKLENVIIVKSSFNYKVNLGEKEALILTFGFSQGKRHVSANFVLGVQTFGFRDVLGQWSLEGILSEIRRQLDLRAIVRKEKFFNIISTHVRGNKAQLDHLLYRFNNNLNIF